MHIPGLVTDIYSFLNFAFTVFFITLGFFFIMQCQCTDFAVEEDDFFDADVHLRYGYVRDRDRDRDSDTNTDTTDTDRYTDTDTDTDRDYYPVGTIPDAPPVPVRVSCLVCGDWSTTNCSRCKVARYCSKTCQMKDWKEGHMLECKEYKPPNSLDSVPDVTSERRDSGHMDISSSGPSSNRDEIPSSSASPHICFVCSNLADSRCSSCKIAKYCSETCQQRHWKEGHKLECKQYRSPADVDSVPAVTRKRDQMPSTSTSSHICFVCGHWAKARCSRCTVTRYCSEACQMKHWNEGHRLECKEYRSPINVDSGHMGISSSEYQRKEGW